MDTTSKRLSVLLVASGLLAGYGVSYAGGSDYPISGFRPDSVDGQNTHSFGEAIYQTGTCEPYQLRIERIEGASPGTAQRVNVILDSGSEPFGGFDFLVGYDANALGFQRAVAGEPLFGAEGCQWEYFTYRFGNQIACDSSCPSGLIRVMSVADVNDGSHHPSCFMPDSLPAVLFSLDFAVTDDQAYQCSFVPIRFLWLDCGDNVFCSVDGNELYISEAVFDGYDPTNEWGNHMLNISDPLHGSYPTYFGAQDVDCFPLRRNAPQRVITFVNGGIRMACPDTCGVPGDLNLNCTSHEIADAVLYTNYFIYGLSVFEKDTQRSVAASDVNQDGVPLTLEDLVLLIRIMVGDADPDDPGGVISPNIATFRQEPSGTVSVETPDTLGAAYLIFSGGITPTLLKQHISMSYHFDGADTRVLLASFGRNDFTAGPLLGNTGIATLTEVQAFTYDGAKVNAVIDYTTGVSSTDDGLLPGSYALLQNYPNPFNSSTVIQFDLPRAAELRFEVVNILGKLVCSRTHSYPAGRHRVEWDGTNLIGSAVASGIYYYRVTTAEYSAARKMLLLK